MEKNCDNCKHCDKNYKWIYVCEKNKQAVGYGGICEDYKP